MISYQNHIFIDPQNCGSSIGYRLSINEYERKDKPTTYSTSGYVVLTDCSHQIEWDFSDENAVDKIDAAISMLQEFRKKYIETTKTVSKLNN